MWRSKEQRSPLLNTGLTLIYSLLGFCLMQLGLAEGRNDPAAPLLFDAPDLQTLTASAFIGVAMFLLISALRLALFTSKLIADLAQGPALLVGYVTTRETRRWRRNFGRQQLSYRLYMVSRQAFPIWLRGSAAFEDERSFNWSSWARRLPVVVPSIFLVPGWAYEMVREGDLIRLHYARWQRAVLNVEVIESVLPPLPAPRSPSTKATRPPEIASAQWRVLEPDE